MSLFGNSKPAPHQPQEAPVFFEEPADVVPAFWLSTKEENRSRFAGGEVSHGRYTESVGDAFLWVQQGGTARLQKVWKLRDGRLALFDPSKAGIPIARMLAPFEVPT